MISKAEKSYIQSGLLAKPQPQRHDGRALDAYRPIALETGVAPLANGSARLSIGGGGGGNSTEVVAAVKLEVDTVSLGDSDRGKISCFVSWYATPSPTLC